MTATPNTALSFQALGDVKNQISWLGRCLLACVLGTSCASTANRPRVQAWADLSVNAIAPTPGSVLGPKSEINATVEYTISNFESIPDRYYLTIQFQKNTAGGFFNHYRGFADEPVLTASHGSVHVRYSLSHIWDDPRLWKPVKVWFFLIERNSPGHESLVIGRAGPFEYGGS